MNKFISFIFKLIIIVFAIYGFVLSAAYLGVYFHLTDTKGVVDEQSDTFWKEGKATAAISESANELIISDIFFNKQNYCLLKIIKDKYPAEFRRIFNLALADEKDLAQKNLDSLISVLKNNSDQDFSSAINSCSDDNSLTNITKEDFEVLGDMVDSKSPFSWASSIEWDFFKTGVLKDKKILDRIQVETGINSRILISQLMAEQMRLFYSDRPWFKKAIAPLKVLGSMTQFSWGVLGIKPETALQIEDNLNNQNSVFYPGPEFEKLLSFQSKNIGQERFERMVSNNDHYYAYLYGALYNKEVISQWQRAGIDISDRPEILATIFNIGFSHSKPNNNPQVGGSELEINGSTYSFGRLASEFYYSGELLDEFPQYTRNSVAVNKGLIFPTANSSAAQQKSSEETNTSDGLASLVNSFLETPKKIDFSSWAYILIPLLKR